MGLVQDQSLFNLFLTSLERDIAELVSCRDVSKTTTAAALAGKIRSGLALAQDQAELFNKREQLFSRPLTDYSVLATYHSQVRNLIHACCNTVLID